MTESNKRQPRAYAWIAEAEQPMQLLLSLWQRARLDWNGTQSMVRKRLRGANLASRERRAVSDCLFGVIRNLRRLDFALDLGGWRGGQRAPDRERILAYLVLEEGLSTASAALLAPAIDWPLVAGADTVIAEERDAVRRLGLAHSLPDWLSRRLVRDLGEEAEAFAASLGERAPVVVRVNQLRSSPEDVLRAWTDRGVGAVAGRWSPSALQLETHENLLAMPEYQDGSIELQDEASQLVAELVAAQADDVVVDLCAGAGGKTLALAAQMEGRGRILAGDPSSKKLTELRKRLRRAGATNVHAIEVTVDPKKHWPPALRECQGQVTKLLVDAPCTGIGALRREPQARWALAEDDIGRACALQQSITARAADLLAPGGVLVYATCTVLAEENDEIVQKLLRLRPELEVVPIETMWGTERARSVGDGRFLRMFPHRHGTDGFFAAVLRRGSDA